jgi:hypothetical protein
MEVLLSKVTQQAMNYAIRSGIAITSGYAIQQCSRLMKTIKGSERSELADLQMRLESKIRIISPAIDMIELIAARGNTSLESAVSLTKSLRYDIQALGTRMARTVAEEDVARRGGTKNRNAAESALELKHIISDIRKLLQRIEDAVPLINLAITTSGASLSTSLPATVSPSRLLQASFLLNGGDMRYAASDLPSLQICPDFVLSVYMLFSGHASRAHNVEGIRETTWKEVMHKAKVKLLRVPLNRIYEYPSNEDNYDRIEGLSTSQLPGESRASEYAYQLLLVEDLDDGRVHTFDENIQPSEYEGVSKAGIRELIPVHEISKIFYADTGKILNIGSEGEANNAVLLLKRDVNAVPPRRMVPRFSETLNFNEEQLPCSSNDYDEQSEIDGQLFKESSTSSTPLPYSHDSGAETTRWRLPKDLDREWIALEVYRDESSDDESESDNAGTSYLDEDQISSGQAVSPAASQEPSLSSAFTNLHLWNTSSTSGNSQPSPSAQHGDRTSAQMILSPQKRAPSHGFARPTTSLAYPAMETSLSLLEMLLRLTSLQQFQQTTHLSISDQMLNFFLHEASTSGAGANNEYRQRLRRHARQRVGFDPYDESPIKRHSEEYIARSQEYYIGEGDDYYDSPVSPYAEHSPSTISNLPPRTYRSPPQQVQSLDSTPIHSASSPCPPQRDPTTRDRASPSPLFRRATAPQVRGQNTTPGHGASQAQRFQIPRNAPPTAPPTSSSPGLHSVHRGENVLKTSETPEDGQGGSLQMNRRAFINTPPESM